MKLKRYILAALTAAVIAVTGCGQTIGTNEEAGTAAKPGSAVDAVTPQGVQEPGQTAPPAQEEPQPQETAPQPEDPENAPETQSDTETQPPEETPAGDEDNDIPEEQRLPEGRTGTATVHLLCAGDNLIHDNIYTEAWNIGGDHYDFSSMYEEIKPYLDRSDIAILNQETLVNDAFPASTYPVFSTPTEDGDAVVEAGFNVISMCNNHVLDKGTTGLISSLDYWDTKPVVHYGAYRGEEDSENIRTMTVNGVVFAFLGYMEHTNGLSIPDGEPGKVVYLSQQDTIKRQLGKARKIADVVVVSCHFGTEVAHPINGQQKELAPKLAEWGADIIIGTQAHCVSKCCYVKGSSGRKAFCYYGLGNFFHTMYDKHSAAGILGEMDVTVDFDTGKVKLSNIKAIPTISHFEAQYFDSMWYNCKVYPLAEYTDDMFARNFNDGVTRASVMECLSCIPDKYLSIE